MTTEVKICGINTAEAMQSTLDAGADYVGLVFFERSPRNVDLATARMLADMARARLQVIALVVDADDALLEAIAREVAPHLIQLHGKETPKRANDVRRQFGIPVMKAVSVAGPDDVHGALAYDGFVDRLLFDAKPRADEPGALPGGNGVAFDWQALAAVERDANDLLADCILAGGLTPENVAEAVRLTGVRAVDVSSGVESSPGVKDAERIRRFISAAKTANQTP
ncbi:phosphoribosylanthranilate isomerase [Hyphomicrobium sp. D-2]|uniref:phosphoribosylanthranilate isomerase n=1 Tax=Hyphomicrobium sp. D-2 TaxID=3041621 RepID=UPI00245877BB|nr:phosphoribosylanthranilate isomerase [Hyphomicrobium sp. D-2]MDH4983866.1 phosphoribosylanthranilate isomerase [Hyphomicrobium sp. D-2]